MGLTELITEDEDVDMSVPRSVGNFDRNGSEFREMWQMEMRAEHPEGRVLRLVHKYCAYCSTTKRRCRSLVLRCVVLLRLSRHVL